MEAAPSPQHLLLACNQRLADFLRDDTDLVWLKEIQEEAMRMFGSCYSDEPELMPKTPSQKTRQRKKRFAAQRNEDQELGRKRLSQRKKRSTKLVPSAQLQNKENLEVSRYEPDQVSPPQRVTRSQTAALAKISEVSQRVFPKSPSVLQEGKAPAAEINISNCFRAVQSLQESPDKPAKQLRATFVLGPDKDSLEEDQVGRSSPVPATPETVATTPKATPPLNAANITFCVSGEPGLEDEQDGSIQAPEKDEEKQRAQDIPGTPKGLRLSRQSVRRSLMGKAPPTRRSSLATKYSRSSRKGSRIHGSIGRLATQARAQQSAPSSSGLDGDSQSTPGESCGRAVAGTLATPQSPRMSLRSRTIGRQEQPQEPSSQETNTDKNGKLPEPPQSARRKPSYKRAVDECYDSQQAEDGGLSPPRRKTPSPAFPASKVVRPMKTFLHTVQKNHLLMTPSSLGRNMVIKSFIKCNTPLQTGPKEKERQKLEMLKKKQEAEQLRKQKLEEEKKRRLDEAKLKREERQRKVQASRERALQLEEERKRRIEQRIAHFEEKTEKVREERLAEEKIKKAAAARKMEEAEARRRQEEEARRQRALQQEEEQRRHKELMQKRKEEEQERARKILEQRQAEQEREKQLAAQRELERKREQERIQAEKLHEQQQKAAQLQKEALAAEKQLQKEEQKEVSALYGLAEVERQEQEEEKLPEEQKDKDRAQTEHPGNAENSGACTSYQMTPHARRDPKPVTVDPDNYGLDLNSDDSTDDESQPRKPIPTWASGYQLTQAVTRQYHAPPNVDEIFGVIFSPKLEDIFYKSKPRYYNRTSSAIWSSPP
ncbi:INCE protein, partial [Psilopogon haemacephalus]|nr:INCE protein [Psilopogon haemacephalus]